MILQGCQSRLAPASFTLTTLKDEHCSPRVERALFCAAALPVETLCSFDIDSTKIGATVAKCDLPDNPLLVFTRRFSGIPSHILHPTELSCKRGIPQGADSLGRRMALSPGMRLRLRRAPGTSTILPGEPGSTPPSSDMSRTTSRVRSHALFLASARVLPRLRMLSNPMF